MRYFEKISEFAPGLPDKGVKSTIPTITAPVKTEFVVQKHDAKRAGSHLDLRVAINNIGYSWAGRDWPTVGEKVLMVRQPDHDVSYFDFSGNIPKGYGAGDVSPLYRGQVELIKSAPDKISFNRYEGTGVEKFTLIRIDGDNWLLLNNTINQETLKHLASIPKLKYKDVSGKYTPKPGDSEPVSKIDGASSYIILRPNKNPLVYSKRISKKNNLQIEYTPKIQNLLGKISPPSIGTTILRGEVFSTTPDNREIPNRVLSGLLNSGVWKSRDSQKENQTPLRIAAFDITKFKGRDVSKLPYGHKQELINDVVSKFPFITTPWDAERKTNFEEGKIIWRNGIALKDKKKKDYDVVIRGIFPAELKAGAPRAGGFTYSWTPRGSIVGKVGSGFEHEELTDMLNNPKSYVGKTARVFAQQKHPSGALRMPVYGGLHIDKN